MTEPTFKAVFSFDEAASSFKPAGHNLTFETAQEKAEKLKGQGLRVQVLDQPSRHKGRSYKTCSSCKSAAESISKQQREQPAENAGQDAPAASESGQEQ